MRECHSLKTRNEEPTGKQNSKQGRTFLDVGMERKPPLSIRRRGKGYIERGYGTENVRWGNNVKLYC